MNWVVISATFVDVVIILMILGLAYDGYRKGLATVIVRILSFILSLIIVLIIYKPVANFIMDKTQIDEKLSIKISEMLIGTEVEKGEEISNENSNLSNGLINIINKYVAEAVDDAKENIIEYVSSEISYLMILLLTMVVLFVIIEIGMNALKLLVGIINKLPILKQINRAGGLVFGFFRGILTVYLILAIILIISPLIANSRVLDAVKDSRVGSKMYNNNVVLNIISK